MSSHPHPSPQGPYPPHHRPPMPPHHHPNGHQPVPPPPPPPPPPHPPVKSLQDALMEGREEIQLRMASVWELLNNPENALECYDAAIKINSQCTTAMSSIAGILKDRDQYGPAIEYYEAVLKFDENNGDVWANLGNCFLMMDNLPKAYSAYQTALYHLSDLSQPKLWYGIGILYDRYGSLEHAEEAFSQVMRMAPDFEKANEIYFRLGIIYKQQQKFSASLECFRYIVSNPPKPLTEEDIWFQLGHVYEQQKDYTRAQDAYERVLDRDPKHAKVLQQLGWLHHQRSNDYYYQQKAITFLEKSVESDQNDAQSWYLLGRCYMAQNKYPSAYEAYQQAVYRDGRNPTFWCSIGVLYYQINQYRDALDAYSRAIRLNPNISEVWYDLGTLYESCANQTADALDAYQRAAELDPNNVHIKARLDLLRKGETGGAPAPGPSELHPPTYQPPAMPGPPGPQWAGSAPQPSNQPSGPPMLDLRNRLNDIQRHPPQGPQQVPQVPQVPAYDHRDAPPPHAVPMSQKPPSPTRGNDYNRNYPLPQASRYPPEHGQRRTPSPKSHLPPGSHNNPPPPNVQPGQQHHGPPPPSSNYINNPNHEVHVPLSHAPPPPPPGQSSHQSSHQPPHQQSHQPPHQPSHQYNRSTGERPPLIENRPSSTSATHHYQPPPPHHRPHSSHPMNQPPPEHKREREEVSRTPIPPKRHREWEDEPSSTKSQRPTDDKRPRLDEEHRNNSIVPSPPRPHQPVGREEYYPSDAAHHPPSLSHPQPGPVHPPPLPSGQSSHQSNVSSNSASVQPSSAQPSINNQPPPAFNTSNINHNQVNAPTKSNGSISTPATATSAPVQPNPTDVTTKVEPVVPIEPAARKMDVDEDYDDEGDAETSEKKDIKGGNGNLPIKELSGPETKIEA